MALTRKSLKAMGLTDEQIDSVIDMHSETVDALKAQIKAAEDRATDYETVKSQLDALKGDGSDYKTKWEQEHAAFEQYKQGIAEKDAQTARESAVRAYFEGKGITGANLDIAMRGATKEIGAVSVKDGNIEDTKVLDDLVAGTYAGLVVTSEAHGAPTSTPPASGGVGKMTKEQIMAITDTAQRQQAISDNHELFGF